MGVQCKLLGHVRDSTEFEERQESRPDGTVLICREYQVCRRCGDREEMYRNEQTLTPATPEPDTRAPESTSKTGSGTAESEPHQATEKEDSETAPAPVEDTDTTAADSQDASTECRDKRPSEAASPDHVTDDAVILSDSPADASPPTGDTSTSLRADGTGDPLSTPVTDDAVVISDSSTGLNSATGNRHASTAVAEPTSQGQITCTGCGREWRRGATSLRDGDLCPACRDAYVEAA